MLQLFPRPKQMNGPDYQKGIMFPRKDFPIFFYVSHVFTFSKQSNTKCFAVRHVRLNSVLPRSDFLHPVMELRGGAQTKWWDSWNPDPSNPSKSPASEASEVFSREGSWNPTKINH